MYIVHAIDIHNVAGSWGEFTVEKSFEVLSLNVASQSKSTSANALVNAKQLDNLINKMNRLSIIMSPCGFILQYVTKKTVVHALCGDNTVKKIENIDEFTNNRVKYMNDSYYELFPILDGKSTYHDSFANGAVLHYEKDKTKWYADNNPPTKGKIVQEGKLYFIPEKRSVVEDIISIIDKSTRKRSPIIVPIFGIEWDLNPIMPANGLPYTTQKIGDILESMRKSNSIQHTVSAVWDGIGSHKYINHNKHSSKSTVSICKPIKETNNESNKRVAITQLKITTTRL